jgi:hypothetical protein
MTLLPLTPVDGKDVARRFQRLFTLIRNKFPKTQVSYISMKPSPSRELLLKKMRSGNDQIKKYLSTKKRNSFY